MIITIQAKAGKNNCPLNYANKIECQENFVEYLDEPYKKKLQYGFMSFFDNLGELYVRTEYKVENGERISKEELKSLSKYTQGQWSDGIGESFEQFPCGEVDGEEIYISPWARGQKTQIIIS